jgi:hypothetical protein
MAAEGGPKGVKPVNETALAGDLVLNFSRCKMQTFMIAGLDY